MQPHAVTRYVRDCPIDDGDHLLDEADEFANRLILERDVALKREIGSIDLKEKTVLYDRLIFDPQGEPERGEIRVKRSVIFVANCHRHDSRRWRAHERLDKNARCFRQHVLKMAALLRDRAGVKILDLASRLRQAAECGNLGAGRMLLRPHALEFRIAVDVGTRRPFPASAEAGQPALDIEKEGVALLLAVVADIDADFALLA